MLNLKQTAFILKPIDLSICDLCSPSNYKHDKRVKQERKHTKYTSCHGHGKWSHQRRSYWQVED